MTRSRPNLGGQDQTTRQKSDGSFLQPPLREQPSTLDAAVAEGQATQTLRVSKNNRLLLSLANHVA